MRIVIGFVFCAFDVDIHRRRASVAWLRIRCRSRGSSSSRMCAVPERQPACMPLHASLTTGLITDCWRRPRRLCAAAAPPTSARGLAGRGTMRACLDGDVHDRRAHVVSDARHPSPQTGGHQVPEAMPGHNTVTACSATPVTCPGPRFFGRSATKLLTAVSSRVVATGPTSMRPLARPYRDPSR